MEIYGCKRAEKSRDDITFVLECMEHYGSISFASSVARRLAESAERTFSRQFAWIAPSPYRSFLEEMIYYMIDRQL